MQQITAVPAMRGVDPALADALAHELVALTALLDDLAFDLAGEPDTLRRHMTSIQAIDRITQAQIAIADVLRSDAPVMDRLAAITLEGLSDRLLGLYERGTNDNEAAAPDVEACPSTA